MALKTGHNVEYGGKGTRLPVVYIL